MPQSKSRLPEIVAELPVAVRAALVMSAQKIAQDAKDRVPYDAERGGKHLRDVIHIEITAEGVEIVAGDEDVFWGHLVEHGGAVNRPPHPFLVPALEQNRDEIIGAVEAAIKRTAR